MKLGFVSRVTPRDTNHHVVLGVLGYKPREFAAQMNLNVGNGWGIVRSIVDMVMRQKDKLAEAGEDGAEGKRKENQKYVLIKDPNKPLLRLYEVPLSTFDETEDGEGGDAVGKAESGDEE